MAVGEGEKKKKTLWEVSEVLSKKEWYDVKAQALVI